MANGPTGILAVSIEIEKELPKNALVRRYTVLVTATPANRAVIGAVATVRGEPDGKRVVIDFGTLRTVRGLDCTGIANIKDVSVWTGLAFTTLSPLPPLPPLPNPASPRVLFEDTRTERLRVDLLDVVKDGDVAAKGLLDLSEAPSDLELRLEGGPVVWSHAGPVRGQGQFVVDLTAAVAALAGDPADAAGTVRIQLTLTSRTPAALQIRRGARDLDRITRVVPPREELAFTAEGRQTLDLPLPEEARSIREVRCIAVGTFAPERVLQPEGPAPSPDAELVADPDHAFCVRLADVDDPAGELAGIRLPLRVADGGAEARVVLWSEAAGEPAEPLDDGASEPVALVPPPGPDGDAWTTFPFPRSVPLREGRRLWAALLVARGELTWRLLAAPPGSGFREHELRRGGPAGPWRPLPSPFASGGPFAHLRGRVRAVVRPAKANPVAALRVQIGQTIQETTPTTRGAPVLLRLARLLAVERDKTGRPVARLALVARAVGTVSLREVDVVWSTSPPTPQISFDAASLQPSSSDVAAVF